jgi:tetratricopeptide (TPR) repeat protein
MTKEGRLFRLTFLTLVVALLLAPACKSKKKTEEPVGEAPAEGPSDEESAADEALREAEDEAQVAKEFDGVMYNRHFTTAKRFRDALELENALTEVEKALNFNPTSDEALSLRSEVLRMMGDRAGETRTVIEDQYEAYQVKRQEQKITVRRKLADAQTSMEERNFPEARRSYESAVFIVTSAKLSPLGTDDELAQLGKQAETGLKDLEQREADALAEQERQDTAEALRKVAEIEEVALMEARDRRAALLKEAIDNFNREEFETAEHYAQQVLNEEPDNRVARDIVTNARKARHTWVGEKYLRDLKQSYRNWWVDIEETKVPENQIMRWPSQSFWDKITRLRATRRTGQEGREFSTEELAVFNTLKTRIIDLPFEGGTPFPQVAEFLSAASGVNFVIDARAREDLEAAEISIRVDKVTVSDALDLIMAQASAEGEIVYEVVGNVVRFIKKEHQKKDMVLRIHPVADLTLGLTDFIPPQITQIGVDEDSETPLFGGQAEEAPQPYGTIEELMELVRSSVSPATWEEGGNINNQGKNLIIHAPPAVQNQVAEFLDDLRAFSGIVITIESRFLEVSDMFLRDVGVDFRGLGGTNGGPLAVLDDITSGFDDNASAALDNSGPGLSAGGSAVAPSSGFFFNDGSDGDFRGRTENIFTNPLGRVLTALGGGAFQITYLDDFALSAVIRATEKSANIRELTAPRLTVYNTQRANITVVNQISFVQDFDVEVAQTSFIADPVIGVIQDGLSLDVRPTVSNDRQYITMELRPTTVDLETPIETFTTLLGAAIATVSSQNPVTIQLPQLDMRVAESTVRIPDRAGVPVQAPGQVGGGRAPDAGRDRHDHGPAGGGLGLPRLDGNRLSYGPRRRAGALFVP